MDKTKRIYIIPGYGETTRRKPYMKLAQIASDLGYEVTKINPDWAGGLMTDWVKSFVEKTHGSKYENSLVIGFSFGAVIAILGAQQTRFRKIILCSLSPYFSEDIKDLPPEVWDTFGNKHKVDFKKHPFPIESVVPASFLIGEKDWPMAIDKIKKRYSGYKGARKFFLVPKADHSLPDNYLALIEKEIKSPLK
ncbi:MAG: hypothetical protein COV01_02345 [Candidatus Taylorbacteria bacterium CG10_big_fil_rev_8_21_14_0_10_41_48]|uniref:Alpha/beta hydrolase n=1 Tax=Candidatus Taylorbacteria bacterium CG10_big_fil_rev_8_21_14_0_10_41_48 TaxID=1975024 RepID=A0A2M8LCH0_9BACT|nr:MAG: hypothetical protein COV01_02345 [Candidatus Taylorbacteria bacterium CG10_big_fil_rev_8_21_14_0_10_41_48]